MSNHLYTRPGGVWNPGTDLLAAELADIDWKSTHSLSDSGGTYSFTEDMVIGGDPFVAWVFDLQTTFSAGSVFGADVLFGDGVQFLAEAEFGDLTTFNDNVRFNDFALFDASVTFSGGALFNDTATFIGSTEFNEEATFLNEATFNDIVTFADRVLLGYGGETTELHGPLTPSAGGYVKAPTFRMTDADVSRGPTTPCRDVFVPAGVLSANRTFTIVDAANDAAMSFSIAPQEEDYEVNVKDPSGTTLAILTNTSGSGYNSKWFDVRKIAGVWTVTRGQAA